MTQKKAFTLTELLIALAIVGAIAALSIPALMDNINQKLLISQLKSTVVHVQQLIDDQLIKYKTTTLDNTDFTSASSLLSSGNFSIADYCTTATNCWGQSYKKINSEVSNITFKNSHILLKNGVSIKYTVDETDDIIKDGTTGGDTCYGLFWVDVNGADKPNMIGRDLFAFRVTKKGKITSSYACDGTDKDLTNEALTEACIKSTDPTACFASIQRNSWKVIY